MEAPASLAHRTAFLFCSTVVPFFMLSRTSGSPDSSPRANLYFHDGHLVANLRMQARVNDVVALHARIINLTDEQYADRADFTEFTAEGYRYFPAMPRQFYVGATFSF